MGRSRGRDDQGTSAVEFSILGPLLLLLVFMIIQGALYLYGRNVAASAAREGVSYLRLAGNNPDRSAFITGAQQVASGYASKLGRLRQVRAVGVIGQDGRVTMTVEGSITLPLGGTTSISQSSSATLEQFLGDTRGTNPGTYSGPSQPTSPQSSGAPSPSGAASPGNAASPAPTGGTPTPGGSSTP